MGNDDTAVEPLVIPDNVEAEEQVLMGVLRDPSAQEDGCRV